MARFTIRKVAAQWQSVQLGYGLDGPPAWRSPRYF